MFIVDREAERYIGEKSGVITVRLKYEPALGGCVCSDKQVTGSYLPELLVGYPVSGEQLNYLVWEAGSVKIYYPTNLKIKEGYTEIRIYLKKFLFWRWLEIEGAQGIAITSN